MKQNPAGTKFIFEVYTPPPKLAIAKYLSMGRSMTRSYCWHAEPHPLVPSMITVSDLLWSDSTESVDVPFSVESKAVEAGGWRRGYWQDPSWQKPALELGKENAILRKYRYQYKMFQGNASLRDKRPTLFDEIAERDEARLQKKLAQMSRKRSLLNQLAEDLD